MVGNEFCTGDYLESIVKSATSSHGVSTFLIADSVYWHNLRSSFSDEEETILKKKAIDMGVEYFENNLIHFLTIIGITKSKFDEDHGQKNSKERAMILNGLAKEFNFEVIFWQDWLEKNPSYLEIKEEFQQLYDDEMVLKKSIEETAKNFARRHQCDDKSSDLIYKRSCGYLIEEVPAIVWIAASLEYHFIAYPGDMIKPIKVTKDFIIKESYEKEVSSKYYIYSEHPKHLANWLEITFQRSHSEKPVTPKLQTSNMAEMMRGITDGIFALELAQEAKLKLLAKLMCEYQSCVDLT